MKRFILMAVAAMGIGLATVQTAEAGDKKKDNKKKAHTEQLAEQRTRQMTEQLGLSKKQAKKVLKLNKEYAKLWIPRPDKHQSHKNKPGKKAPSMASSRAERPDSTRFGATQHPSRKNMRPGKSHQDKQTVNHTKGQHGKHPGQTTKHMGKYDKELQGILSTKQYDLYKQQRKEQMQKRVEMRNAQTQGATAK